MKKALIIKISSMGDLIHTLPALSDAARVLPGWEFDWVAAPTFAEIPTWHPAVKCVIPCAIRHWRQNKRSAWRNGDIQQFISALRRQPYDLIIDAQSALKSAIISKMARGPTAGFDRHSVREYGAHWFYRYHYQVNKNQHAITRLRDLFAQALGYSFDPKSTPDFGIAHTDFPTVMPNIPKQYIILMHGTTWPTKCWPIHYWQQLITQITQQNYAVLLPWGNTSEKCRAETLAKGQHQAIVLPKLSLSECAGLLLKAKAAVCVDTGLGHLAAALKTPAVHLYGPTNPQRIGANGEQQIILTSTQPCHTRCKRLCYTTSPATAQARCMQQITPQQVWQQLLPLIIK